MAGQEKMSASPDPQKGAIWRKSTLSNTTARWWVPIKPLDNAEWYLLFLPLFEK
jgi:hypothetical protein